MNELPLDIPAWVPAVKDGTAFFETWSKESNELTMFARSPYNPSISHDSQVFINLVDGAKYNAQELAERYSQVRRFIPIAGVSEQAFTAPYSTELMDRAEHNLSVAYLRERATEDADGSVVLEAQQSAEFAVHAVEVMTESRRNHGR